MFNSSICIVVKKSFENFVIIIDSMALLGNSIAVLGLSTLLYYSLADNGKPQILLCRVYGSCIRAMSILLSLI